MQGASNAAAQRNSFRPPLPAQVVKSAAHFTEAARDEVTLLTQIRDGDPGDSKCCVRLFDHFEHCGPNGTHVCMVFEVMGNDLLTLIRWGW